VEVGCVYWEVVLVIFSWVCPCFSLLRANERLFLLRRASAGDRQEQTTLAQGKWIAFIDSVFRVLGSGAVWPEVIRMHAGVAVQLIQNAEQCCDPEQQHLL
jgi:hypothetical protein